MNRRTLLIGASALGLVAFGGGTFFLNRQRKAEAEAVAAATPAVDPALLIRPHSPSFGPADAPVTLVEFFDPSCEACRAFHPTVMEIKKQFPTQVRVVLRYTVFHQGSDEAVRILEVARMQDKCMRRFHPIDLMCSRRLASLQEGYQRQTECSNGGWRRRVCGAM